MKAYAIAKPFLIKLDPVIIDLDGQLKGPIAVVVAGVVGGLLAAVATVVVGRTIETGSIGIVAQPVIIDLDSQRSITTTSNRLKISPYSCRSITKDVG